MKKIRGFRLGRKLLCAWRWATRRRCRGVRSRAYLRLDDRAAAAASFSSPSDSPHRQQNPSVTTKIASWGRRLTRRLLCPSSCLGGRGAATAVGGYHHLPCSEQQQQQQREEGSKPPPKGHLAVYVGRKEEVGAGVAPHRFLVPVIYVNHPLFAELLQEAEQEFGYHHPGGITIPCPISDFETVRTRVAAAAAAHCLHSRSSAASTRRWRRLS